MMDVKLLPTTNYLEEYRRKYKPISNNGREAGISYASDVHTLLNKYLGSVTLQSQTEETSTEPQCEDQTGSHREHQEDDIFDDEWNGSLLPTSVLSERHRITVDQVIKDSKLNAKSLRRNSSPLVVDGKPSFRNAKQRASSSPEGREGDNNKQSIPRRNSDMGLHRRDSNLSNVSLDSTGSSNKCNGFDKNDILEFSDEDFDFDLEIDLNSSKQSDTDSQKLFSLFQLDTDSQKDGDSLAGVDEVDGSCVQCHPVSARSAASADSTTNFCTKCTSQRKERYATIKEILESEHSYLKDLQLIHKHFHDTLLENGLLNPNDVSTIFGNLSGLIAVSQKFCDHLSDHLQKLQTEGDDYYHNAAIGQLVCDSSAMFLAFETYCLNYGTAISMVDSLKKDNQLFNLFLEASQTDNPALRRMDLKTFLMMPVQRVMKYPLLLKRLHKATHHWHTDRELIEKANDKLTNILHHINAQSKVLSSMFAGPKDGNKPAKRTSFEIALTKLVLDTLNWKHDEIHFVMTGKLGYLLPGDYQWAEKLRTLRLSTAFAVIATRGKKDKIHKKNKNGRLIFPRSTTITDAALLIIKKGNSRLQVLGEPFYLARCLISHNSEFYDVFEVAREFVKEPVIIRPVRSSESWYRHLKYYSMVLGGRNVRRRNALPNILLPT